MIYVTSYVNALMRVRMYFVHTMPDNKNNIGPPPLCYTRLTSLCERESNPKEEES